MQDKSAGHAHSIKYYTDTPQGSCPWRTRAEAKFSHTRCLQLQRSYSASTAPSLLLHPACSVSLTAPEEASSRTDGGARPIDSTRRRASRTSCEGRGLGGAGTAIGRKKRTEKWAGPTLAGPSCSVQVLRPTIDRADTRRSCSREGWTRTRSVRRVKILPLAMPVIDALLPLSSQQHLRHQLLPTTKRLNVQPSDIQTSSTVFSDLGRLITPRT